MVQRSRLALEFPEPAGPASMLRGLPRPRLPLLRFDSARASALTVQPAIRFAPTSVPPEQGRRLLSVSLPYSTLRPADSLRRFPGLRFVHIRGLSPPLRTFVRHLPAVSRPISSRKRSWAFPFRGFPFDDGPRSYLRFIPSGRFRQRRPPCPCSRRLGSSAIHGAVGYRVLSVIKVRSHDPLRLNSGSGRSPPGLCFPRVRR